MEKNIFLNKITELKKDVHGVYIYGAGLYARNIYAVLKDEDIQINGFIVTHKEGNDELYGLPITEAGRVLNDNIGIIIGVNSLNKVGIVKKLKEYKFNMGHVISGTEFIEKSNVRYDGQPTMQITTRIGCRVHCRYCPQDLLSKRYFQNDKKRESVMSVETFEKCLNKLPQNARVSFCGMAEPFLNPDCNKMIKMAHESGRIVELYTTLVGADKKIIEEIAKIPFGFVVLHVADKLGYAHIPLTSEYYELVEFAINYKRQDGLPFVNMCNAQAEPDEKVAQICKGKYEILTALHDRAGNLENESLCSKNIPEGKIVCSLCGESLNHNNLLPDGTVLLCDFDYGMQHVLGNLLEKSYVELFSGDEWRKVYNGMSGDTNQNILCRQCSCANAVL